MHKLFKYLKPFFLTILFIVALLFVQAMCDLSLPDYMSNIVNTGIQQGGISNAVPEAIRQSEFEKVLIFMDADSRSDVSKHYALLDKDSLPGQEYSTYVKKYPLLETEAIMRLTTSDKDTLERLNPIMGKAILIVSMIETKGIEGIPGDPFEFIKNAPPEMLEQYMSQNAGQSASAEIPESMITQSAIESIKKEYSAIGINLEKLQSSYIINTGLMMLLVALLSMAATVLVSFLSARVSAGLGRNMRKKVYGKVTAFSNTEFDKFSTASLITRTTNDIQQVQMSMVMLLRIVFYAPILGVGGVIKVLATENRMGWIIAVAVMTILTVVLVLLGLALPKFKKVQKLIDKLNLVSRESLVGMLVIRAFSTQRHEEERFDGVNSDLTRTHLFVGRMLALMMPLMTLVMNLVTLLIVWVGAHQVDAGTMQVGNLMAFIQYTMQIIMSFLMISMVSIMLPRASVSAQRMVEVLDTEIAINDPEKPTHFSNASKGLLEFDHVSFRYPGAADDVLHDISFVAKPGEITAFIGSTGSGKTTLVNLIPRLYDVTEGKIFIDGVDIRDVKQSDLRERIGYVPQKSVLFSGTIESNLKFGDENAAEQTVDQAARIAQAAQFIQEKPEGLQASIAQGGTNVSGGQKQRLAIARALVKKADIYIFDDSFSALDFKTDSALRKALQEEMADTTLLIVAQRINTIMNAHQIIVMEDGQIVGKGTHQELMESCQVYKEIALSQLSKEELAS
jgi:ATP-binding cassette subfamily B multidrug efflux pump